MLLVMLLVSTHSFYTIITASCMGHIASCNILCNAMLKSSFLTLQDKFRDQLLSVTPNVNSSDEGPSLEM